MEKDIAYKTIDGVKIYGTLQQSKNPKAIVILLHGIAVDRNEYLGFFRDAAEFLAENNTTH